jgi:hypothetical protein
LKSASRRLQFRITSSGVDRVVLAKASSTDIQASRLSSRGGGTRRREAFRVTRQYYAASDISQAISLLFSRCLATHAPATRPRRRSTARPRAHSKPRRESAPASLVSHNAGARGSCLRTRRPFRAGTICPMGASVHGERNTSAP